MLVISTQNWSILAKFAKNIQRNRLFFTDFFLAKFPPKFPVKSADFSKNLPRKSFEIWLFPLRSREIGRFFCEFWLFSRENHAKWADFWANFDFFPAKIPRNRPIFPRICPGKSREILLFFHEISEALTFTKTFNVTQFCLFTHLGCS